MLFIDASDFGHAVLLYQHEKFHGTPQPIGVFSKRFNATKQKLCMRFMNRSHVVPNVCQDLQNSPLVTRRIHYEKIQPTHRISKKMVKIYLDLETLLIERVYIAGEDKQELGNWMFGLQTS